MSLKIIATLLIPVLLTGCETLSDKENLKWIAGAAAVGAAAYYIGKGGGGGSYAPPQDFDWDWDQFMLDGRLSWACRGVQTGQFAEHAKCAYKPQTDWRWPNN